MYQCYGLDMLTGIRGGVLAHANESSSDFSQNFQQPEIAIPVITILAITLMLGVFWLLKRYSSWQFPINKKGLK